MLLRLIGRPSVLIYYSYWAAKTPLPSLGFSHNHNNHNHKKIVMSQQEESSSTVNLLELAAATVACTVTASRKILNLSTIYQQNQDAKNARLKSDGSFVTDADFAAQGSIVQAIRSVSENVRIVGEESAEEMATHIDKGDDDGGGDDEKQKNRVADEDEDILQRSRAELRLRLFQQQTLESLPLSPLTTTTSAADTYPDDPDDCVVDASRVSVIVDPLDGTKSYATGDYDSVSILIGIILDNTPIFGVIGKPFGYTGLDSIRGHRCVTVYGGELIRGVYIAGAGPVVPTPLTRASTSSGGGTGESLPRAVISSSRSIGVVQDFCRHLGDKGLVHPEPLLISGAGEKSLRLILQKNNEALWFFPKAGTSRWDVAAPDALLRTLGGKLTDKWGRELDYSKSRDQAENVDGVVACIDAPLHAECIKLFAEGNWADRTT